MNQIYLNGPSAGRAMSAEEFARAAGRLPDRPFAQSVNDGPGGPTSNCGCGAVSAPSGCDCGCGCGGAASDCPCDSCGQNTGCCQQMICCCHSVPTPRPPQVDEACCCKQSFRAALGLLCDQQISSLLDFSAAAFLTDTYAAGTTLTDGKSSAAGGAEAQDEGDDDTGDAGTTGRPKPPTPTNPNGPSDNLGELNGSFRRFAPCTCDLLDIDAELYTTGGKSCALTATQVSLCQLAAVAIQAAAACSEGDLSAEEVTARNFRCVRQRLAQRLDPNGGCGQEQCSCSCDCDEEGCCCAAGLLSALSQNNLSRRVSLAAGLLAVQNVTLLGTVGSVLVLANDTDNRLYFVCVNSVQFIA